MEKSILRKKGRDMEYSGKIPSAFEYNSLRLRSKIGGTKSLKNIETALRNSLFLVSVYEKEQFIGMGRIVGDGGITFAATDIMVDEAYQCQGIGKEIMARIDEWFDNNTSTDSYIMLIANKPADEFYKKYHFKSIDEVKTGMLRDRKED